MEASGLSGLRCFRTLDGKQQPGAKNSRLVRRTAGAVPDLSDEEDNVDPEEVAEWVTDVLLATCEEAGEAGAYDFQKFLDALDAGELLTDTDASDSENTPTRPPRASRLAQRHDADLPSKLGARRNASAARRATSPRVSSPRRVSTSSPRGVTSPRTSSPRITSPLSPRVSSPSNENAMASPLSSKRKSANLAQAARRTSLGERSQMAESIFLAADMMLDKSGSSSSAPQQRSRRHSIADPQSPRRCSLVDPTGGLNIALSPPIPEV